MKKYLSILTIIFTFLISITTNVLAANVDYTIIDNVSAKIKAGETIEYIIKLKNVTGESSRKTEIEYRIQDDKNNTLEIGEETQYIGHLIGSSVKEIPIKITAKDTAKIGKYEVNMNIKYYDANESRGSVSKSFYIEVIEEKKTPRLEFSAAFNNNLIQGEMNTFNFKVYNAGEIDAKNIKIELTNMDKKGLYVEGYTNIIYVDSLPKEEAKPLSYNLTLSEDYSEPTANVNLKYSFVDAAQNEYNGEQTLYVDLNDIKDKKLSFESVSTDKTEIVRDEEFVLKGTLKNAGAIDIKDVEITVELENGIIPISQSKFHESIIKVGEGKEYIFKLKATDDADEKNYNIKIKATYKKGSSEETEYRYAGVYLKSKADSKKSVPKIIIGEYKVEPTIVKADSNFNLQIGFKNTHSTKVVKNIKAFITVDEKSNETGNVFSPVNASNTFYIPEIDPGKMVTKNVTMYTVPDASPKTYEIIINIEYEDNEGNQISAKELIGIPVQQRTKIELSDITIDGMRFVGREIYIVTNVLNTGMTDVRNVKVTAEGQFEKASTGEFYGKFQAGNSQYVEQVIIPNAPGEVKGEIVVSYEDLGGNEEQIRKEFSFIAEQEMREVMGGNIDFEGGFKGGRPGREVKVEGEADWVLIGIISGVVLVTVTVVVIKVFKKRKKKKEIEMMIDE